MPLQSISDNAVAQICEAVSTPMSDDERARVAKIVEQAVVDSAVSMSQRCVTVVNTHAEHETDLAHKIAKKLEQEETALVANLMGLR